MERNFFKKEKNKQKCPRCGEKSLIIQKKCENCGLIFDRLKYASNKEAIKCMLRGEREKIIKTTSLPQDRNKWVAGALCAFLGFAGAHNFYLGRYAKAFFSFGVILLTAIFILLLEPDVQAWLYSTWMVVPCALVFFFWFYDLILILINKYKIPIALKMPSNNINQVDGIIKENKLIKENKSIKENNKKSKRNSKSEINLISDSKLEDNLNVENNINKIKDTKTTDNINLIDNKNKNNE